jgi:hypothetical protein
LDTVQKSRETGEATRFVPTRAGTAVMRFRLLGSFGQMAESSSVLLVGFVRGGRRLNPST